MIIDNASDIKSVPDGSYVYHIIHNGELVYIGSTTSVKKRMEAHFRYFGDVKIKLLKQDEGVDIQNAEAMEIVKFNPLYNKCLPPNYYFISESGLKSLIGPSCFNYDNSDFTLKSNGNRYYIIDRNDIDEAKKLKGCDDKYSDGNSSIKQMIKKLGGHRATIAKQAGISEQSLNNLVSQKREVLELLDGRFIVVSKHTVVFGEVNK